MHHHDLLGRALPRGLQVLRLQLYPGSFGDTPKSPCHSSRPPRAAYRVISASERVVRTVGTSWWSFLPAPRRTLKSVRLLVAVALLLLLLLLLLVLMQKK